jgi:hypothetical protein
LSIVNCDVSQSRQQTNNNLELYLNYSKDNLLLAALCAV